MFRGFIGEIKDRITTAAETFWTEANPATDMTPEVTRILEAIEQGDREAAARLLPIVYAELRRIAAAYLKEERPGHTLDPTALVHEAYVRLVGDQRFENRAHFFAAAARAMRRILIENARRKARLKHGGGFQRQPLDVELAGKDSGGIDLLTLDDALGRLAELYPLHARHVELRYFAGLSGEETARILGVSPSTIDRQWLFARAWLRRELAG